MGLALLGVGCVGGDGEASPLDPDARGGAEQLEWAASLDGRVVAPVPPGLVVHRMSDAVMGTADDGGLRLFVGHRPPETLIRAAGRAKDALRARGYRVEDERHYTHAIDVRFAKGDGAARLRRRAFWIHPGAAGAAGAAGVDAEGDVEAPIVRCDGEVDGAERAGWLEEPLWELCRGVRYMPEAAPDRGSSQPGPGREASEAGAAPSEGRAP